MERFDELKDMHRHLWNMLFQATVKRNHPMRTPVLATCSGTIPFVRTVVLRDVDTRSHQLFFFTDSRSDKVDQLRENEDMTSLFWDPGKKVQIRCRGKATLEQGTDRCRELWDQLNAAGRSSYAALMAPGTKVDEYTTGLPEGWSNNWPDDKTDAAFAHFMLLIQDVTEIDGLHLEQNGHQRALFTRRKDDNWDMSWLIP